MPASAGFMAPRDGGGDINSMQFMVQQALRGRVCTAMIVKVMKADRQAQTVAVQPMVQQMTPTGSAIDHATIFEVPYGYEAGGVCRVKIDPAVGDIGVAVFAHRDITRVKRTRKAATPATTRSHNIGDALYVRSLWTAGSITHEIAIDPDNGITVTSSSAVHVNAPRVIVSGDVVAGGISLMHHTHTGVQSGSASTGEPK